MPMPSACPARNPAPPPPSADLPQMGVPVSAGGHGPARHGDNRATLTPTTGSPLVIATPMVTKATYDKARGGLVPVPSAPGAQQLQYAEWKSWSACWKSYVRALQSARHMGFKILGAHAHALRDWIVPRLTGEHPAGTPSLTTVFNLIGRDLRAAQESASTSETDVCPQEEPSFIRPELDPAPEDHGLSPSQN